MQSQTFKLREFPKLEFNKKFFNFTAINCNNVRLISNIILELKGILFYLPLFHKKKDTSR
jgi:hypothetical protein